MATTKKRLNISLTPDVERAVRQLAARDHIPQATKIAQLLQLALEVEEDQVWDMLAQKRDTPAARFISHNKAWV
jgi:hypothetical protein